MKFIVITPPEFFPEEASLIALLLRCGVDTLHLRKPGATYAQCAALVDDIRAACGRSGMDEGEMLRRIVVHDHHELCREFSLQGVHLNSRNPLLPEFVAEGGACTVSASCHSIDEARRRKPSLDYVFLSPIFDSISKQDYRSAYSVETLSAAALAGVIDGKVMALGGVSLENIHLLKCLHFGGAAFLGDVWSRKDDWNGFVSHAEQLADALR